MTPSCGIVDGETLRLVHLVLPWPAWDKNSRIGWSRGGRRFMVPTARDYRQLVTGLVRPRLPHKHWFGGEPWSVVISQHQGAETADVDHYVSGLMDDLCFAGLARSDDACDGILVFTVPHVGEPYLVVDACQVKT